jgi:hypothetical protein
MAVSVQAGPKAAKEPRATASIVEAQGVIKTYYTGKVQALRGLGLTLGRGARGGRCRHRVVATVRGRVR